MPVKEWLLARQWQVGKEQKLPPVSLYRSPAGVAYIKVVSSASRFRLKVCVFVLQRSVLEVDSPKQKESLTDSAS